MAASTCTGSLGLKPGVSMLCIHDQVDSACGSRAQGIDAVKGALHALHDEPLRLLHRLLGALHNDLIMHLHAEVGVRSAGEVCAAGAQLSSGIPAQPC